MKIANQVKPIWYRYEYRLLLADILWRKHGILDTRNKGI